MTSQLAGQGFLEGFDKRAATMTIPAGILAHAFAPATPLLAHGNVVGDFVAAGLGIQAEDFGGISVGRALRIETVPNGADDDTARR